MRIRLTALLFLVLLLFCCQPPPAAGAAIPEWERWQCEKTELHFGFRISYCPDPQTDRVNFKYDVDGSVFLLVWDYDPSLANPMKHGVVALLQEKGQWFLGSRGTTYRARIADGGLWFTIENKDIGEMAVRFIATPQKEHL